MTIKIGDPLPQVTFTVMTDDGPQPRTTDDIFKGRRVALVGVPGAFTPTCCLITCPAISRRRRSCAPRSPDDRRDRRQRCLRDGRLGEVAWR